MEMRECEIAISDKRTNYCRGCALCDERLRCIDPMHARATTSPSALCARSIQGAQIALHSTATVSRAAAVCSLRAHPSTFSAFPYYARSRICASSRRTRTELSSLLLDNSEKCTSTSMARRARWKVQACRTVLDRRPGRCAATECRRSS